MPQWVYDTQNAPQALAKALGHTPDLQEMKVLLGGKGAGWVTLTQTGTPVPPAFTLTTEACRAYLESDVLPPGLWKQVLDAVQGLESQTGKRFGDPNNPLLVSVRTGARQSMPGMMDAVLYVGLNSDTRATLAALSGDEVCSYAIYRHFVMMFSDSVMRYDRWDLEAGVDEAASHVGVRYDTELTLEGYRTLLSLYHQVYRARVGEDFPSDPYQQLELAIRAGFRSWNSPHAVAYREAEGIPHDWGVAVTIGAMVFGNLGQDSGVGLVFSRDPNTGAPGLYGEYLLNARGDDLIAGPRTPIPIEHLAQDIPEAYDQLRDAVSHLEQTYRDMQDVEFLVERGRLWILQTRTGKRAAAAAIKIAVDMVAEGLISKEEAVLRVRPEAVAGALCPQFALSPRDDHEVLAQGMGASLGAAVGALVFDPQTAQAWREQGRPYVFACEYPTPNEMPYIMAADGVLMRQGGVTRSAVIVCRGMNTPAVVGVSTLTIEVESRVLHIGDHVFHEGDVISLDGSTGQVFAGERPLVNGLPNADLRALLTWADELRREL